MDLAEWTEQYIKHRDLFFKKLVEIKKQNNLVEAVFKDKTQFYFMVPALDEEIFNKIKDKNNKIIVCDYEKKNIKFVADNWEEFVKISNLLIIFVNPVSGKKLLLNPQSHNKVADPSTIKEGLFSMFDAGLES